MQYNEEIKEMPHEFLLYQHNDTQLEGYLAYTDRSTMPRPLILIAHDWRGRTEFTCEKANDLAKLGYVGFALDD